MRRRSAALVLLAIAPLGVGGCGASSDKPFKPRLAAAAIACAELREMLPDVAQRTALSGDTGERSRRREYKTFDELSGTVARACGAS